jgi:hypothetical protein
VDVSASAASVFVPDFALLVSAELGFASAGADFAAAWVAASVAAAAPAATVSPDVASPDALPSAVAPSAVASPDVDAPAATDPDFAASGGVAPGSGAAVVLSVFALPGSGATTLAAADADGLTGAGDAVAVPLEVDGLSVVGGVSPPLTAGMSTLVGVVLVLRSTTLGVSRRVGVSALAAGFAGLPTVALPGA